MSCAALMIVALSSGQIPLCSTVYIQYDPQRRTPAVVVQELRGRSGPVSRTDDFRVDERLPERHQASLEDYRRSGYDRGHLAPAADFTSDHRAMSESFRLTNIVPQNPDLNREAWAGLEGATRACAKTNGRLLVITGVRGNAGQLKGRVTIPAELYKIWITSSGARAWVFPNKDVGRLNGQAFGRYEVDPAPLLSSLGARRQERAKICPGALPYQPLRR